MSYLLLKKNISRHVKLSEEELEVFCNSFTLEEVGKKQFILKKGDVCKFEGFVVEGCFRVYTLDDEGKEHILYFAPEDWWITDIDSFTNQTPARLWIEAIEDCKVLLIGKEEKEQLYQELPAVEKLFRIMTQKTHVALQRRMISNLSKKADERYIEFIEKYPELALRLSNLQIAAYLGITHEFLSKIRSRMAGKC